MDDPRGRLALDCPRLTLRAVRVLGSYLVARWVTQIALPEPTALCYKV